MKDDVPGNGVDLYTWEKLTGDQESSQKFVLDSKAAGYGDLIATFQTVSTNDENGTYNMTRALMSFDGVTLQPGESISFFDIAGPCGAAQGYKIAGVVGGTGYGGGICQAATTLYGAALRAGLTIVQRQNHSTPSTYVPIGLDAMVNYGTSDLVLRNDWNFPIKISVTIDGRTLICQKYGTQPSWYDYIEVELWYTGTYSAAAQRKFIKNGSVVRIDALPSSYY